MCLINIRITQIVKINKHLFEETVHHKIAT